MSGLARSSPQEWALVGAGPFRRALAVRTVWTMKTFMPLFAGLTAWFLVAVVVLSTFGAAPPPRRTDFAVQPPSRLRVAAAH
jgi:hypothetical protein